jgi:MraZ protein
MLFWGESEHTLDPNGRVIIPTKYRFSLGETFVIAKGHGKCLRIFTQDWIAKVKGKADKIGDPLADLFDPEKLRLSRFLGSQMVEAKTDAQCRVVIPQKFRDLAEIGNSLVLIGVGDWIEIWNPDNWKTYSEREFTEEKMTGAGSPLAGFFATGSIDDDDQLPQTGPSE